MKWRRNPPRDERDAALDDELRTHLAMATAERIARGESPEEAALAARRELGNVGHIKEVTREMWGGIWLERLRQDLRYAWRSLVRSPGFAAVAVLTLALGIGANVAMFTVVDHVLLRPLPFKDPDRLVLPSYGLPRSLFFPKPGMLEAQDLEYTRRARLVESVATAGETQSTLSGAGEATRLVGAGVTPGFFGVLGVRPAIGRAFVNDDDQPGGDAVIIGDGLWRERFGADPSAIGRAIMLDGERHTIIGVMPPGFDFPFNAKVWTPIRIVVSSHEARLRTVIARLAPGATPEQALAEVNAIIGPMEHPFGPDAKFTPEVLPLRELVIGKVQRSLYIFGGAVFFVLLIACANVANLLLMRATTRRHEIAVRVALGADRWRLIRQLLTESTLVAFLAGVVGLGIATVGVRALVSLAPAGLLPRTSEVRIDVVVFLFTAALCLLTGIGFGLAPALQVTRRTLGANISATGRAIAGSRGRLRGVLVITEIALALMLLTGAGLVVRSFLQLRAVELGFQPKPLVAMTLDLPKARYKTPEALHQFRDRLLSDVAHLPGVVSATAVNWRPLGGALVRGDFKLPDGEKVPKGMNVSKPDVTPGYFSTMGIRVREGREFTNADDARVPGVVIVSKSVAEKLWPGRSAIGQRLSMADRPTAKDWLTVVGVVDDVIQAGLRDQPDVAMYQPLAQIDGPGFLSHLSIVVRSASDPTTLAASMRDAVHAIDVDQPVQSLGTMKSLISSTIAEPLFQVRLLSVFSLCALLLAAIGIYGVLAYAVTERTREIGIRVAVGARPADVIRMVVARTIALAITGIVFGVLASLGLTRVLTGLLFQVKPTDPATFAAVGTLLFGVALAATIIPARRAARVDPLIALRNE
jgi:putative ABC transport system permease protein